MALRGAARRRRVRGGPASRGASKKLSGGLLLRAVARVIVREGRARPPFADSQGRMRLALWAIARRLRGLRCGGWSHCGGCQAR